MRRDLALPGHLGPLARKLDHLSEDDPVRESTNLVAEQQNLTKVRVDDRDRLRLIQEWAQRVLPNPSCVSELQDLVEATMEVGNVVKTMTVLTNKNAVPKAQSGILRETYAYSPKTKCVREVVPGQPVRQREHVFVIDIDTGVSPAISPAPIGPFFCGWIDLSCCIGI